MRKTSTVLISVIIIIIIIVNFLNVYINYFSSLLKIILRSIPISYKHHRAISMDMETLAFWISNVVDGLTL